MEAATAKNKRMLYWVDFDNGVMGVLPCGVAIVISQYPDGYKVRFGLVEIPYLFTDLELAKAESVILAQGVLNNCFAALY